MTALIMESEKAFLLSYVLLVALMILTLLSYIRKRVYDYSMLEVLGIQKNTSICLSDLSTWGLSWVPL